MNKDLEDHILHVIQKGEIKMRSRSYFIVRDILGIVAIVIVLLMAVYLASFIIFVLHQNGAWFVPVFGLSGWFALFTALPWMLILLSVLFIIVLTVLAKRYQFASQWPMLYSILGAFFLIAAACFIFVQTSFYNQFFSSPIAQDMPFLGLYYPGFGRLESNDIHRGIILVTGSNGFALREMSGNISNIIVSTSTNMPFSVVFEAGDAVVVFGDRSPTGTINAAGVEKLMP